MQQIQKTRKIVALGSIANNMGAELLWDFLSGGFWLPNRMLFVHLYVACYLQWTSMFAGSCASKCAFPMLFAVLCACQDAFRILVAAFSTCKGPFQYFLVVYVHFPFYLVARSTCKGNISVCTRAFPILCAVWCTGTMHFPCYLQHSLLVNVCKSAFPTATSITTRGLEDQEDKGTRRTKVQVQKDCTLTSTLQSLFLRGTSNWGFGGSTCMTGCLVHASHYFGR